MKPTVDFHLKIWSKALALAAVVILMAGCSAKKDNNENSNSMELNEKKEIVIKLLAEALPSGNIDYVRKVVSPQCVTNRAGFAALYAATGDPIPQRGNFLQWMGNGLGTVVIRSRRPESRDAEYRCRRKQSNGSIPLLCSAQRNILRQTSYRKTYRMG